MSLGLAHCAPYGGPTVCPPDKYGTLVK